MAIGPDGLERHVHDRTGERYFITEEDGVERETDADGFVNLERRCGFRPKSGLGPFATGGFSSGKREGRIEAPFRGPAKVLDTETGEHEPADNAAAAHDRARELNEGLERRRHYAMPA